MSDSCEYPPIERTLAQPHSKPSRDRKKVRENWLAGESSCPTEAQALAPQRGTDAFVCQPGDLSDSLTASKGALNPDAWRQTLPYGRQLGSDWGFMLYN